MLLGSTSAQPPAVPNVVGEWAGFYAAVGLGGPDTRPVALGIDGQRHRRVSGELSIGDPSEIIDPDQLPACEYPVSGTLTGRSRLVLRGKGCGTSLAIQAALHDFGRGGAILEGALDWATDDESAAGGGHLVLLRHYKGQMCDNIDGHWTGQALSEATRQRFDVQAEFHLDPQQATGFFGRMSFAAGRGLLIDAAVLGTNNNEDHGTLIVGAGAEGVLVIHGDHQNPPDPDMPEVRAVIHGAYFTRLIDGTLDFGTFEIVMVDPTDPH